MEIKFLERPRASLSSNPNYNVFDLTTMCSMVTMEQGVYIKNCNNCSGGNIICKNGKENNAFLHRGVHKYSELVDAK